MKTGFTRDRFRNPEEPHRERTNLYGRKTEGKDRTSYDLEVCIIHILTEVREKSGRLGPRKDMDLIRKTFCGKGDSLLKESNYILRNIKTSQKF